MSDANGFSLFDRNSDARHSSQHSSDRFAAGLDPDARERLAAMYRENEEAGADGAEAAPVAEPRNHLPEGLESLLSRASEQSAASDPEPLPVEPMAADEALATAEPSPEDLVAEAMAAVEAGTPMSAAAEAEDVKEFVEEIRREQSLSEIAEAAQSFVAEQTGEVVVEDPASALPDCAPVDKVAEQSTNEMSAEEAPAVAEVVAPNENLAVDAPAALLEHPAGLHAEAIHETEALPNTGSDVPWEPINEAAKRYEVEHANVADVPAAVEAQAAVVEKAAKAIDPVTPPPALPAERRRKRRALISAPLRVRSKNCTGHSVDEVATTVDVSRLGVLFQTELDIYQRGMEMMVTFPYSKVPHGIQAEQPGVVARIQDMGAGKRRVAIVLGVVQTEHIEDTHGRKIANTPIALSSFRLSNAQSGMLGDKVNAIDVKKPLVLAIDASLVTREALKSCLEKEGYEVLALSTSSEGRDVLNVLTPALIFAEVEGEGLPGYDICAHVKQMPRLRHIPVVLTTSSAYPSDYSSAHSLGAVVCMAKPYKMERIANIARLLAPPPMRESRFAPRPADPSRLPGRDCNVAIRNGSSVASKSSVAAKNGNGKKPALDAKSLFKFPSFRSLSK